MSGPMFSEHLQSLQAEGNQPIFVAFTSSYMDQHPLSINVGDLEMQCFLESESHRIDGPEEALHGGLADRRHELIHFGDREDGREFGLVDNAEFSQRSPIARTRLSVKELDPGIGDLERVGLPSLLVLDEQELA